MRSFSNKKLYTIIFGKNITLGPCPFIICHGQKEEETEILVKSTFVFTLPTVNNLVNGGGLHATASAIIRMFSEFKTEKSAFTRLCLQVAYTLNS
jgi:hypothetical protein